MSTKALERLVKHATGWARAYTAVHAALIKEGVPEEQARNAAMMAAVSAASAPDNDIIPGDEWREDGGPS